MSRVRIVHGVAGLLLLATGVGDLRGQTNFSVPSLPNVPSVPHGMGPARKYLETFPEKASVEPAFTIPVSSMGYSIPGTSYLLRQQQLVSLDFIDENRLLFSFHVASGLRERSGDEDPERPQQIHAVVVDVATGKTGPETDWSMPDRRRYLWMLNDGRFLMRVAGGVDEGDAELKTKEYLRWPGQLMWIQMDPEQKFLMANSLEAGSGEQTASVATSGPAEKLLADGKTDNKGVLTIRTVRRANGEVVQTTKAPWTSQTSDWPMNSEGYVERLHDKGAHWVMEFIPYGAAKGWDLADADSVCVPQHNFVTDTELLVSRCDPQEGWRLKAWIAGKVLWDAKVGSNTMWPLLMTARNGSRAARETLVLKRSAEKYKDGVRIEDVLGQMVRVFDAATGKTVMEAPISPIYDGGGNVAVSPSGKRVAVLNGSAIQVYELPPPSVRAADNK